MSFSPRFNFQYLVEGQHEATKDYNDVIGALEALTFCALENHQENTPPTSPSIGHAYTIGSSASGVWTNETPDHLAIYTGDPSPGWYYIAPPDGMVVFDKTGDFLYRWDGDGNEWIPIPRKMSAISDLNQTITGPSVAEVQAISDKVDEILQEMRDSNWLDT